MSLIDDQRGTTLVELMVALMAGIVIISALTMVILTTLHSTSRVTARVHATQRARIAMVRLMEQLHSACVTPEIAPIQEGSTGTSLRFIHQTGSGVQPVPIYSVVSLSGNTLYQQDYAVTGTPPAWGQGAAIGGPRTLLTDVGPTPPNSSIFSYHRYAAGTISETPQTVPLEGVDPSLTVEVRAALTAAPESTPVKDAGVEASVQNSATLRLTPPSYNEGSPARPCQ